MAPGPHADDRVESERGDAIAGGQRVTDRDHPGEPGPVRPEDGHRRGPALDGRGERDDAAGSDRGPESELRDGPAARGGVAEPGDGAGAAVLHHEDRGLDRRELEPAVEGDEAAVVEPDTLGELREDATDRRVFAGADPHLDAVADRHEDAPGHRFALDDRREGHAAARVDGGRAEAGEGAAGGSGIALGHDLPQHPAAAREDRIDRLAATPDRGEEDHLAARVDGRGIDARDDAGRDPRRRRPGGGDRA